MLMIDLVLQQNKMADKDFNAMDMNFVNKLSFLIGCN